MAIRNKGEGSIYKNSASTKKSNQYTGLLKIGINPNGKTKSKRFYGATKSEVAQKMRNFIDKKDSPVSSKTFEEVFQEMFSERKTIKQLRPKTVQLFSTIHDSILKPYFCDYQIKNITEEYVKEVFENLKGRCSYSYLTKIKNIGSLVFKYAQRFAPELINPFKNIVVLNEDKDKPRKANFFTDAEMQRLIIAQDKNVRYPQMLSILWNTGLRINELLALEITDLDFSKDVGLIDVNKTLIEYKNDKGKWVLKSQNMPKTKDSFRKVPMISTTRDYLKECIEITQAGSNPKGLVFATNTGGYISSRNVLRTFNQTLKHAGIEKKGRSIHSIRHSATSLFINTSLANTKSSSEEELALVDVKKILGHKNIDISAYIYDNDQNSNALRFAEKYKKSSSGEKRTYF